MKNCKLRRIYKNFYISIAILFLVLFITTSCDLFTGPKVDLFQIISDEVDWHNAAKLTVRVDHPNIWGRSNPTGNITPTKDIRKGYAFELEFTPNLEYSFNGWRAYKTSSLQANWTTANPEGVLDALESERLALAGLVEVPDISSRGGAGSFKIHTTEPITLVPFCKTEPYVTWTTPPNSPVTAYSRNTDIIIYFNAPLNFISGAVLTTLFTSETIKITADDGIAKTKISGNTSAYNAPVYTENTDSGQYKITIKASDVPGNRLIEVTIGLDIFNKTGNKMSKPEIFSFGTAAASGGGSIATWGASYNTDNTITVNWTKTGTVDVVARYRVNQGGDNDLATTKIINGVTPPTDSRVREGESVSNINEYEIFLDLYIEGAKNNDGSKSFKIWNIPGMNVNITPTSNDTVLLTQANFATALVSGSTNNFVLTEDLLAENTPDSGIWTPLAGNFTGKFYGNGHTVTISNMTLAADMGFFGRVNGGIVRDLTVNCNNVVISQSGAALNFGGIAGQTLGAAQLINVLVKGAASVTLSSDHNLYVGGIAGQIAGTSTVQKAYSSLAITVDHPTSAGVSNSGSSVYVGDIAGYTSGTNIRLSEAAGEGDITVTASGYFYSGVVSYNGVVVGGLVACLGSGTTMTDSIYRQGIIKATVAIGSFYIGGAIGFIHVSAAPTVTNCSANAGKIDILKTGGSGNFYAGGFMGYGSTGTISRCYSENNMVLMSENASILSIAGGFSGTASNVSYCYAKGTVSVKGSGHILAGGFAGRIINANNCYAAGNVYVINNVGGSGFQKCAGGFTGCIGQGVCTISDCYALGDVFMNSATAGACYAGGFSGTYYTLDGSDRLLTIKNSFAAGSVTIQSNGTTIVGGGGFIGNMKSTHDTLINNAVLGRSVTITSPASGANRGIGRIWGYGAPIAPDSGNNYAYNAMGLYDSSVYGDPSPAGGVVANGDPDKGQDKKHGADAHFGNFRDRTFWGNADGSVGLKFNSTTNWDFSTVEARGYPILRASSGGPAMGGQ